MRRLLAFVLSILILLSAGAIAENATTALAEMYAEAELLMAQGDYSGAATKFESMGAYSDASQMAMYCKAVAAAETMELYDVAIDAFTKLGDFKDCKQMATYYEGRMYQATGDLFDISSSSDSNLEKAKFAYDAASELYSSLALFKDCLTRMSDCQDKSNTIVEEQETRKKNKIEAIYQDALALEENREYNKAIDTFKTIEDYRDSKEHILSCEAKISENTYQEALKLEEQEEYKKAIDKYISIGNYKDSIEHIGICKNHIAENIYQEAKKLEEQSKYQDAIDKYMEIENFETYKDCVERIETCRKEKTYNQAIVSKNKGKYVKAMELFFSLGDYKDSLEQSHNAYELYHSTLSAMHSTRLYYNDNQVVNTFREDTYYHYGSNGKIKVEKKYWQSDGGEKERESYTIIPGASTFKGTKNGAVSKLSDEQWKDSKDTYNSHTEYDSHCNLTKETKTYHTDPHSILRDKDGLVVEYTYQYTYDNNENLIHQVKYENGEYKSEDYIEYTYDDIGRISESITTTKIGKDNACVESVKYLYNGWLLMKKQVAYKNNLMDYEYSYSIEYEYE